MGRPVSMRDDRRMEYYTKEQREAIQQQAAAGDAAAHPEADGMPPQDLADAAPPLAAGAPADGYQASADGAPAPASTAASLSVPATVEVSAAGLSSLNDNISLL